MVLCLKHDGIYVERGYYHERLLLVSLLNRYVNYSKTLLCYGLLPLFSLSHSRTFLWSAALALSREEGGISICLTGIWNRVLSGADEKKTKQLFISSPN